VVTIGSRLSVAVLLAVGVLVFAGGAAADPIFNNVPGPQVYVEASSPIGGQATFLFPTATSEIDGHKLLPVWCTHFSGEWYPLRSDSRSVLRHR
jgi:hypothetical protein